MPLLGFAVLCACLQAGSQAPPKNPPKPPADKLVVSDITVGTGDPVANGDQVTVDYTGKLTSGKVFDTSKKPGRTPFVFFVGMGQVIQGWDEGLIGMKAGGARKLVVPGRLGYGEQGSPPTIPPNATLVFTVALKKVEHPIKRLKINTTHQGDGPELTWGNAACIKLTGKRSDGTVFISTGDDMPYGAKVEVGKTQVPPGFTLGILGMKKGETRTILVPPDLGFGEVGNPQLKVKPNETLTLDVELVAIGGPPARNGPSRSKDGRE